jgi:hypothetical protein
VVAYVRTVKTASGAIAVQIVHSNRRGSREIEHIGSAHTSGEVEVLKTVARQRLHANQDTLDFDDGQLGDDEAPIVASQAKHLWETLTTAYQVLGLDRACADEVFCQLVLARVVEPTSKLDSIRVLTELGITAASYPTIKRRLPVYATEEWRQALAAACADHVGLGPSTLILYDVTTLYFETDTGDGFREPGFSKERRLEPQIAVGLPACQLPTGSSPCTSLNANSSIMLRSYSSIVSILSPWMPAMRSRRRVRVSARACQ